MPDITHAKRCSDATLALKYAKSTLEIVRKALSIPEEEPE